MPIFSLISLMSILFHPLSVGDDLRSFAGGRTRLLGGVGIAVRGLVQHTLRRRAEPFGGAPAEGMGRIVPKRRRPASPEPWHAAGQLQHQLGNHVGFRTESHDVAIATHLRAGKIFGELFQLLLPS